MKPLLPTLLASALLLASCASPGETPAPPPCCREDARASAPLPPLPGRSVYQLGQTWTDENGRPLALESLRGQTVVLALFFTNCEYACPVLTHDMAAIRSRLPPETAARTRFVLCSMDPARDTPEALRGYRARQGLGPGWTLLRGEETEVRELALVLGVKYKRDTRGQFSHGNAIFVLDRDGVVQHRRDGLQVDNGATVQAIRQASR